MRAVTRGLEAAACAVALLALAVIATGGATIGGVALTRPEDLVVALAALVAVRALLGPLPLPRVAPGRLVAGAVAAYVVLMGFIAVSRHVALRTHALDLGYYVQVVWSIAHGHGARVTLPPMHAWGDHLSPILYLFVPLAWVAPGAVPLLLAQTVILAAGGLAVYRLAALKLGDPRLAAGCALVYLVNPSLHGINIRDVHPAAFAIPLLIAAALAVEAGRWGWCAAALALTLACREDAAIAVAGFGVWLALAHGRWALGGGLAAACVLLLAADLRVVMPYFRGEPYPHLGRYAHLGGSLTEILTSLALRPWRWAGVLLTAGRAVYLLAMLAPLAFLPLLAPRVLAAAAPALAMNLLATDPVLFHHRTQYQSFVLPFLVLAMIAGLARYRAAAASRRARPGALLLAAVLVSVALSARTVNDLGVGKWALSAEHHAIRALVARVPAAVPVSVNERLVPHLAARREVYVFPGGIARSEWILDHEDVVARHAPLPGHVTVAREAGWLLLHRRPVP